MPIGSQAESQLTVGKALMEGEALKKGRVCLKPDGLMHF